jgi:hypothetical protein
VPQISDVFVIDTAGKIEHRGTKFCVYVSVAKDKWLLINTANRGIYNELEIKPSEYGFLGGVNRFVACSQVFEFDEGKVIKKAGNLNYGDMVRIAENLKKVRTKKIMIQLKDIIVELEKWLADYSCNKLADVFNKR